MDAVVGTLQSPSAIYAASKLAYFDKMRSESEFCVRPRLSLISIFLELFFWLAFTS